MPHFYINFRLLILLFLPGALQTGALKLFINKLKITFLFQLLRLSLWHNQKT